MENLYSLYDALVSINVSSDKARAVVDAMERDMGTTLATKQDLELLRRDVENRFALLDQKIDTLRSDMSRDLAALDLKMTVKLGSMLFVGFGLTITALRLWT
ncbi:MAG TPA: hypothetical protein VMM36_11265 [Opitutaceae bacterium]|nr:hypothetical protein [Opitutaceae bacterium]